MGCWNETDLLSRLPIVCGQRIACVFIAPVNAWPETIYSDSQYVPVSLPFKGRYDDYGRIEDTEYSEAALESLSKTAFWTEKDGDWKPVEPPLAGDRYWQDNLTEFSDMARQGRLWVRNDTSVNGHAMVRLAFIHEDLWDFAVEQKIYGVSSNGMAELGYRWPVAKDFKTLDNAYKHALAELAAANAAMNAMRVAWQPTCGTGHQGCIDDRWQVKMYRMFTDRANAFYKSGKD